MFFSSVPKDLMGTFEYYEIILTLKGIITLHNHIFSEIYSDIWLLTFGLMLL